jgi:putative transcriptional regulator
MGDPRFDKSVVFMCAHSEEGAMGLVVNNPSDEIGFVDLLEQLGIERGPNAILLPVHLGGPVELGRGFVLHSRDYGRDGATLDVNDAFGMTATLEVLEDLAQGRGPQSALLALGYAGWGPGQLESEIQRNGWLTCDATKDLVFGTADADKWSAALKELGVDAKLLSGTAGRA